MTSTTTRLARQRQKNCQSKGRIEKATWRRLSPAETFDIEQDTGSPVSTDYAAPNPFTGTLKEIEIDVKPANLSSANQEENRSILVIG